jgi:glucosamine--fructose-6-phosphate aminotransferase (isomerizing)
MCGIFAAAGNQPVAGVLLEGLRRLEYRGYDSAGIATLDGSDIECIKVEGNVAGLGGAIDAIKPNGHTGVAHTRWATHGVPSVTNSHPHLAPGVAVVHNGIIENHAELRHDLLRKGCTFVSQTDTEVIPWLLSRELAEGATPHEALIRTTEKLDGSYATAFVTDRAPGEIFAARKGSPMIAAIGKEGAYLSSDLNALAGYAKEGMALEEGDTVRLTANRIDIFDAAGRAANRRLLPIEAAANAYSTAEFEHFMKKEIFEQPSVAERILQAYGKPDALRSLMPIDFAKVRKVRLIACGTSFYAASIARRWLQEHARIEAVVEIASEFRYDPLPDLFPGEVAILISQSGETADTLAAMERLHELKVPVIGIVNTSGSTLDRRSDVSIPLLAGPEIGVASTKAFTAQLIVLARIVLHAASQRGMDKLRLRSLHEALASVPDLMQVVLHNEPAVIEAADAMKDATSTIFVGRGELYPLACEGALKLKETSYIHAEGFAAGELKHGPIALIDNKMPVVALAGSSLLLGKLASNIREIAARGGRIMTVGDRAAVLSLSDVSERMLTIPTMPEFVLPIVAALPLQLLSYHVATARGLNVDRPRNLAKSVTVE